MTPSNKPSSTGSAANPTDFSMMGKPVEEIAKSRTSKWMTEKDFFDYLRKAGELPPTDSLKTAS